jgi:hypothetical protein
VSRGRRRLPRSERKQKTDLLSPTRVLASSEAQEVLRKGLECDHYHSFSLPKVGCREGGAEGILETGRPGEGDKQEEGPPGPNSWVVSWGKSEQD